MLKQDDEKREAILLSRQSRVKERINLISESLPDNPDAKLELKTLMREHEQIQERLKKTKKFCCECGEEIPQKRVEAFRKSKTLLKCVHCAQKQENQQILLGTISSHRGYGCENRI